MLKSKLDTSSKGKDSTSCDTDLNVIENGRNETKIIARKIVEYFNSLSKHTDYQEKKVMLNENLNDLCIKDLYDIDD